jgi:hypothetical protein
MMDSSGGGGERSSFSKTWALLNDPSTPWMIAYASLALMALMAVVLWLGLQDFKEKVAAINPEAFESCIDQMERMQADIGVKYKVIECRPDGALSVTAVYTQ